ncbi:hypothetical protein BpHYR1_011331 [Brachionus plicatilis]|uniref:Uncharacterized protein n=1 Tax=Brachionus plicatilis TaxID=10195 RepID=A0A3M7SK04_BRAPC|nr:hypothetical protein BpHYR1_011331 [Brachionus plicatilis]
MKNNKSIVVQHYNVNAHPHLVLGTHFADHFKHRHVHTNHSQENILISELFLSVLNGLSLLLAGQMEAVRPLILLDNLLIIWHPKINAFVHATKSGPGHGYLELIVQIADEHIAPRGLFDARERHRPTQHRYVLIHMLVDVRQCHHMIVLSIVVAGQIFYIARVAHVPTDLEREHSHPPVLVVLVKYWIHVIRMSIRDYHDHFVASRSDQVALVEQTEHFAQGLGEPALLARVLSLSVNVSRMKSMSRLAISSRRPVMDPLTSSSMRTSLGDAAAIMYHDWSLQSKKS